MIFINLPCHLPKCKQKKSMLPKKAETSCAMMVCSDSRMLKAIREVLGGKNVKYTLSMTPGKNNIINIVAAGPRRSDPSAKKRRGLCAGANLSGIVDRIIPDQKAQG